MGTWLTRKNTWLFPLLLCSGLLVELIQCQGLSVIGSRKIQSNSNYTIVLSNSHNENVQLQALLKNQENPDELQITKSLLVNGRSAEQVEFNVGNIAGGDYVVVVNSLDNNFPLEHRAELQYDPVTMSAFVQTDKPVYNPGDLIRFRVVVVDRDTRPVTSIKTVEISLLDSVENIVRKWPFARLRNGVFDSAAHLPSSPVLGKWTLTVMVTKDIVVTKQIDVKEFVLPNYFVKAYPSNIHLVRDKKVSITVETAYTFGEPVEGTVRLELFLDAYSRKPTNTRTANIYGQTTLDVILAEEVDMDGEESISYVQAKISFIETLTNHSIDITEKIPIYGLPYAVTFLPSQPLFRPGVPYPVSMVVKDHSGKPPHKGRPSTISVRVHFELPIDIVVQTLQVKLDENGVASFILQPPSDAQRMSIAAHIDGDEYDESFIHAYESSSQFNININLAPNSRIQPNQQVKFDVACTEAMTHFFYVVIARGNIVASSVVHVPNEKKQSFSLQLLPKMAPESRVIVYYINNGFLDVDSFVLQFDAFKLKLALDKEEYTPGSQFYLNVDATEDAYVAFSGNDEFMKEPLFAATYTEYVDFFYELGIFLHSNASYIHQRNLLRLNWNRLDGTAVKQSLPDRIARDSSWLWRNESMDGKNASLQIVGTVPNTSGTYYVSGFALSPTLGLCKVELRQQFTVKKLFFMIANLPYFIKRDEVVQVSVTVFNFLGVAMIADVTLLNDNQEIEFVENGSDDPTSQRKAVFVSGNKGQLVPFMIRSKKIGPIKLKFEATSQLASDAIEQVLRVTPESHLHKKTEVQLFSGTFTTKYDIFLRIPRDIDEGSARIEFKLDPGVAGLANNTDISIQKPTTNRQQDVWIFSQNIIIFEYHSEMEDLTESDRITMINYLQSGYRNLLTFKLSDGSFNIWKKENTKGSTFSTAMATISLLKAAKYIKVDQRTVNAAFQWLASIQKPDGRFEEETGTSDLHMQGALLPTKYALTSYVLMAFGENQEIARNYRTVVGKIVQYLVSDVHNMTDVYDLSMATYGLSLIKDSNRQHFLEATLMESISDPNTSERYWNRPPVDVEVAGYALLSLIANDDLGGALPIARWLMKQLNGSSSSTVGVNALAKFAARYSSKRNDYRVEILSGHNRETIQKINVQKSTSMVQMEIPSTNRILLVEMGGNGTGWFQVEYQYKLNMLNGKTAFDLNVQLLNTSTYDMQHLEVCVKYKPKEPYELSNVALVEIFLPSGLIAEADPVNDITGQIKRYERRFANTTVVVYYNNLGPQFECFQVTARRRFAMDLHMPSYVTVYDYYHRDRFAIQQYEGKMPQLCDICEDANCETLSC